MIAHKKAIPIFYYTQSKLLDKGILIKTQLFDLIIDFIPYGINKDYRKKIFNFRRLYINSNLQEVA